MTGLFELARNFGFVSHDWVDVPEAELQTALASMKNQVQWGQDKVLRNWIRESRLDGFGKLMGSVAPDDTAKLATLARFKEQAMAAMANLPRLVRLAAG